MSNPAPVLIVSGTCHAVVERNVPPAPAVPDRVEESSGRTIPGRPARPGYTVQDVTVLTERGGFATLGIQPDQHALLGGELPSPGDKVTYAVRCYVAWRGETSRRYAAVGYSVAAVETTALRNASDTKSNGRPVAAVNG